MIAQSRGISHSLCSCAGPTSDKTNEQEQASGGASPTDIYIQTLCNKTSERARERTNETQRSGAAGRSRRSPGRRRERRSASAGARTSAAARGAWAEVVRLRRWTARAPAARGPSIEPDVQRARGLGLGTWVRRGQLGTPTGTETATGNCVVGVTASLCWSCPWPRRCARPAPARRHMCCRKALPACGGVHERGEIHAAAEVASIKGHISV